MSTSLLVLACCPTLCCFPDLIPPAKGHRLFQSTLLWIPLFAFYHRRIAFLLLTVDGTYSPAVINHGWYEWDIRTAECGVGRRSRVRIRDENVVNERRHTAFTVLSLGDWQTAGCWWGGHHHRRYAYQGTFSAGISLIRKNGFWPLKSFKSKMFRRNPSIHEKTALVFCPLYWNVSSELKCL